jgi:hypothetical protein
MNPLNLLAAMWFRRTLQENGSSITIARLCTSQHLGDLQWLATFLFSVAFFVVISAVGGPFINPAKDHVLSEILNFGVPHGALATVLLGATFGILSWLYRSGNRRIGAIDLFACEISVICRVCLVSNLAVLSVERAKNRLAADGIAATHAPPDIGRENDRLASATPAKFTSEEHYTPIYDTQLAELIPLSVNVVTPVTQFYTYRKTMMDCMRALSAAETGIAQSERHVQMIYMQYLMYESARSAIFSLTEFEPNRAESIINILCSEVVAYAFLRSHFGDDYRGKRLQLRGNEYGEIIKSVCCRIVEHKDNKNWEKAATTSEELLSRYRDMCRATGIPTVDLPDLSALIPSASRALL